MKISEPAPAANSPIASTRGGPARRGGIARSGKVKPQGGEDAIKRLKE
jgi:hypothetical protein